jgi:hypothetical protein
LLKGIENMKFKLGDMVVLTDESKIWGDKLSPIFVISIIHPVLIYGYQLGKQPNSETLILGSRYRLATESEIKTFKLKNLFTGRAN